MHGRLSATRALIALLAFLVCLPGLASAQSDPFVWVDSFKDESPTTPTGEYVISVGDMLSIQIWNEERMSRSTRVRTDGRISLAFLNDVEAAGKGPVQLANEIANGLKAVVRDPRVTVVVEESKPLTISILGEVGRPGLHTLDTGAGVAQALASAGGLNQYAKKDRIFVLRPGPKPIRIRFTYTSIIRNIGNAPKFRFRAGDVLVVE